ncbi:unnamed protein product, partial [Ectocarpus fasciculatus]
IFVSTATNSQEGRRRARVLNRGGQDCGSRSRQLYAKTQKRKTPPHAAIPRHKT